MELLDALHHLSHALAPLHNGRTPNSDDTTNSYGVAPVDIIETPNNYTFILDVPGLSNSDIQVLLEEEDKVLVVKSSGKRKREAEEEGEVKYLRMERTGSAKFLRKFRLPQDADLEAIKASCQSGVLTVTVGKVVPPEPKKKTVQVTVA